ncbi:uncharacterized protein LOC119680976 [Teleopsis dalmanni]|uniref:uncharacterized protein LOC119680976 n=1 Tax=Teleopsis dalmanni TaxID=139649 RepID=UPI0018CCF9F7|nr:uncharacterized protein LOC119680976 [Teleopsis dalmanni]
MLQTQHCIYFGRVLMNQNGELFILCTNCHKDFDSINKFRVHLEECSGLERFFQTNLKLIYNSKKSEHLFQKTDNGVNELFIYNYQDVQKLNNETTYAVTSNGNCDNLMALIDIDEELHDSRWYSELPTSTQNNNQCTRDPKKYSELVQEVTPFVQFKENVKNNTSTCIATKNKKLPTLPQKNPSGKQMQVAKSNLVESKITPVDKRAKRRLVLDKPPMVVPEKPKPSPFLEVLQVAPDVKVCPKEGAGTVKSNATTSAPIVKTVTSTNNAKSNFNKSGTQAINQRYRISVPANAKNSNKILPTAKEKTETVSSTLSYQLSPIPKRRKIENTSAGVKCKTIEEFKVGTNTVSKLETYQVGTFQEESNLNKKQTQNKSIQLSTPTSNKNLIKTNTVTSATSGNQGKQKETEQILNKLQTLGLKVKRTTKIDTKNSTKPEGKASAQTLEIINKLKSNGMNIKLVSSNTSSMPVLATVTPKPSTLLSNNSNVPAAHGILLKKTILKKV